MRSEIETAVAALSSEPAVSGLLDGEAAAILWSREGNRVLWASPAAEHVGARLAGLDPSDPARTKLRTLGSGLAPRDSVRLDTVETEDGPVEFACRLVTIGGNECLLAIVVRSSTLRDDAREASETGQIADATKPDPGQSRLDDLRSGGMRRFIWSADSEERFTSVSQPLAEVVGAQAGNIVGRRWSEIVGRWVFDPDAVIARSFARRTTWSNQTVLWSIDGTNHVVPVDLGGMPVYGRSHEFEGFRGFGLCRTDEIVASPEQLPAAESAAEDTIRPDTEHRQQDTEVANTDIPSEYRNVVSTAASQRGEAEPLYGALQVRIGAQLGTSRPIPLRVTGEPAGGSEADAKPILSTSERGALREIARALGAKLEADEAADAPEPRPSADIVALPAQRGREPDAARILDRIPTGIMVLRGETPLFLNRFMLDLVGFDDVADLVAHGGFSRLFAGRPSAGSRSTDAGTPLSLVTRSGSRIAVDARLTTIEWSDLPASLMLVRSVAADGGGIGSRSIELELERQEARLAELRATIDLASIGVAALDGSGRILSLNRSAETLFGYAQNEVAGEAFTTLLAPESHRDAIDILDALRDETRETSRRDREVFGRTRKGETVPLLMTAGRIEAASGTVFSVVFTDVTSFKRTEGELNAARRAAEGASLKQSEFLARVSHEIRTPLNAIIGFAEIMLGERFGAIGNERYRLYLKDIHDSGNHVVSLVNDLLDIAKIASGKSELSFVALDLNDVVAASVGTMQPSAARDRIVVRTGFAPGLPKIVADERSIRQIALNLVANAIRFTEAGGQVIVSTSLTDQGDVALRIRDTGIGMSPEEVEAAMEPFRQVSVSARGGGTGLGLPLSKALVEANHGIFSIRSAKSEGTLIEVLFPKARVLAD